MDVMTTANMPRAAPPPARDVESIGLEPGARVNEVIIGRGCTLFLAGGSHSVFEIVSGRLPVPIASLDVFLANIRARTTWASEREVPYRHLIFPDKQSIVPEDWPLDACVRMGEAFCERGRAEGLPLLYPVALLARDRTRTVSRVDTHVTAYGSILVAAKLVEELLGTDESLTADRLLAAVTGSERRFGDLGSKLDPPASSIEPAFVGPVPGKVLTNGMKGGSNGGIDVRLNARPVHDRRLVMFGDSFGRDICAFLQHWFREVIFLRTGFFHRDLAERLVPDVLVTENVERYLDSCVPDEERPDFLMYPLMGGGIGLEPSDGFGAAFSALLAGSRPPYRRFALEQFGRLPSGEGQDEAHPPADVAWAADQALALPLASWPVGEETRKEVLEPVVMVERRLPEFLVDLSGLTAPPDAAPLQDIHSSILMRRKDVLLFGPSIQVTRSGLWACESQRFADQFMEFAISESFAAIFPGTRPRIERGASGYTLSAGGLHPGAIREISEPVFLATPLEPMNWGRWVVTVIPKIEQFHEYGAGRKFLCYAGLPWQRALLERFGISGSRLMKHDPGATYLCRDLMTIDYNIANMTVSRAERALFDRIGYESATRVPPSRTRRLYVSRLGQSGRNPSYRVLQNERELIARLDRLGFVAVEPEALAFDEQVVLFAQAEIVVCLGGAALYNCVFCAPGTFIVTIESSFAFFEPHTNLLASLPIRFGVVIGAQDPTDAAPVHKRWTVDTEAVAAAVSLAMADTRRDADHSLES